MLFTILLWLSISCLAAASLPWGSQDVTPGVKTSGPVSFDPLAILAILWNPRASVSASRLYAQPYHYGRKRQRWPHLMQIGAVTVPVSVLVNHLTRNYRSIHPALEMFMGNVDNLNVKSTIGKVVNLFPTLPVSGSESSFVDSLAFRPSKHPRNDIMVVSLLRPGMRVFGTGEDDSEVQHADTADKKNRRLSKTIFGLTEVVMGVLVSGGLTISVLLYDIWGVVLFGSYFLHWLASTAASLCQLVESDTWKEELNIRQDNDIVFAIYERPSGGWVIFKGTQETMERWARTSWRFVDNKPHNRLVHWAWMMTGLFAALSSVANMINMTGYMQLGFLGVLVYGSVAELWLTVLDQMSQPDSMSFLGPYSTHTVAANDKKYKSIVQACLSLDNTHRLGPVPWTELGLLPKREPFLALEQMIQSLHSAALANGDVADEASLDAALVHFDHSCKDLHQDEVDYQQGIRNEVERVWRERIQQEQKEAQPKAAPRLTV
ncbi:hypothetical protein VFPPC_10173 [Pochonia chlamydosporia 170]|uniref:Uncharacterized protein n=1 Tax=Pochonia chlamydosporia 170 TaxID=1380566 RepID=A0A179F144_METCM|nr:hypothetical protein VFPPC_10173 [Pochonia chlamydosporia 170]OAQ59141.1 hypothetical protein VFPPC_10173 [Pochonia chlamydosporia 170]